MKPSPANSGHSRWLLAAFALALAWLASGCASNNENLSERPWNAPRSWETGLPSGMMEERR